MRAAWSSSLLLAAALAGCAAGDPYANRLRPPAPITVSAALTPTGIEVSPRTFGGGPVVLIVSNQTKRQQRVTLETVELSGTPPGLAPQTTPPIRPRGVGTLKVDLREGSYVLRADGVEVAIAVGERRPSAQNELLQP